MKAKKRSYNVDACRKGSVKTENAIDCAKTNKMNWSLFLPIFLLHNL